MKCLFIDLFFGFTSILYANAGSITGQVIDADTHQTLIGANVILIETDLGNATNTEGKFSINNIPLILELH